MKTGAVVGIVFLFLLLVIGAFVVDVHRRETRIRHVTRTLERKLAQAQLLGTSPQKVIAFLDREKIEHSTYVVGVETNESPTLGSVDRYIIARNRDVARLLLPAAGPVRVDVIIVFAFDNHDRLTRYAVERSTSGF
jgi:hypothetical protein